MSTQNKTRAIELGTKIARVMFLHAIGSFPIMTEDWTFDPDALPDAGAADDLILQAYQRRAERRLVEELMDVIRQANAPRPLVILEREQADFLRNLILDLIAGNESARFAIDRLRIGLDLLDGRTRT